MHQIVSAARNSSEPAAAAGARVVLKKLAIAFGKQRALHEVELADPWYDRLNKETDKQDLRTIIHVIRDTESEWQSVASDS
jgi:hypothetical protein